MIVLPIRRVAVLGAGVMGASIAGQLANVGLASLLLDMVPTKLTEDEAQKGLTFSDLEVRNRLAQQGKQGLLRSKPAALYSKQNLDLITVGNFEDDFEKIASCDWIIEVIIERLESKRAILAKVDQYRQLGSIVSSNTSGVSIHDMAQGRSTDFQKHFLGTHFFNPPRYMKLLELTPTSYTDTQVVTHLLKFGEDALGKGLVLAKDTPNFIANRIGTFGLLVTLEEMSKTSLGIDDVDAITGPVLGRPKSATFRTLDLVGLDTFLHVANNVKNATQNEEERRVFTVPEALEDMVKRGWLGEKTGQGFFKKQASEDGKNEILVLDLLTMTYRKRHRLISSSYETAKQVPQLADKMKALVYGKDEVGKFVWNIVKRILLYSASLVGEIADDINSIDQAMEWGFNWGFGPFRTWDAIGLQSSVLRMQKEGLVVPDIALRALEQAGSFYQKENEIVRQFTWQGYEPLRVRPRSMDLIALKQNGNVILTNPGASLVDLGDGVACLDFHSPKQAIGIDMITMMKKAADEVEKNYQALVLSGSGTNFCVGANLMMMLSEAQDENWDDIDFMIRSLQQATIRLKYLARPVVTAPYGMVLGGGAELCFLAGKVQAAAETYMGLVEVGVGLIPAGGGTKEMVYRAMEQLPVGVELQALPVIQKAFETVAMAKVSTSAKEAQELGYLRQTDGISVSRDHVLYDAKQIALAMSQYFNPKKPTPVTVLGESGAALLKMGIFSMKESGFISEYDAVIATKLLHVMTGGKVTGATQVAEQYLLDLEREAFLSLLGEQKTQQRMQYMLQKGKPLRN